MRNIFSSEQSQQLTMSNLSDVWNGLKKVYNISMSNYFNEKMNEIFIIDIKTDLIFWVLFVLGKINFYSHSPEYVNEC
jgi:hypothetical protein